MKLIILVFCTHPYYEMKEISGCSFITIGRRKHNYNQLDMNLTGSAPRRASDDVQHAEHYRVIYNGEMDETIQNLHKTNLEKEIKNQNLLLANLSSQLLAANCLANEEAENKQNLSRTRTVTEKTEEINRLNLQLAELSSTLQDAEKLAANSAETKQNLSKSALKQEEEIQRLSLLLINLSSIIQAKDMKEEESKEYWSEKVEQSENTRISERDFANLTLQRQKAEICN